MGLSIDQVSTVINKGGADVRVITGAIRDTFGGKAGANNQASTAPRSVPSPYSTSQIVGIVLLVTFAVAILFIALG